MAAGPVVAYDAEGRHCWVFPAVACLRIDWQGASSLAECRFRLPWSARDMKPCKVGRICSPPVHTQVFILVCSGF